MKKYKQQGTAFTRMLRDEERADKRKPTKTEKRKKRRKEKRKALRGKSWSSNGNVNYYAYIVSPEWKIKRQQVLKRDGFKCRLCKSDRGLQVHHLTYARLGWERLEDLQTLCSDCHAIEHEDKGCLDSLLREFRDIIG